MRKWRENEEMERKWTEIEKIILGRGGCEKAPKVVRA